MKGLLIILLSVPFFLPAQNKLLVVAGAAPGLYLTHTIAPKENYYSVGRIYNISPKEVAPFNNLVLENGLSLGQTIKIPLSPANFVQSDNAAADEALIPVYHTVAGKEGLYRISVNYNKVPVETLKQWNNLKGDAVSNGTHLIIGYLKVKKDLSPLVNMAKAPPAGKPAKVVDAPKEIAVKAEAARPVKPGENLPPATPPLIVKEVPPVVEKTIKEPVQEPVLKETLPAKKTAGPVSGMNFNGGVFKSDYEKQTQAKDIAGERGEAAIFKSTSGWKDGKYYCLHNSSAPGTIVKITNTSTGKSIYAKVLDTIPDIQQNTGLLIRISNAGAEELGAGDTKFDCSLSYSK